MHALLQKTSLDPEVQSNYWPMVNIPFSGKVHEKVVAVQLLACLEETDYFNSFWPSHGTEIALAARVDYI